jgi:hypothetical protein
MTGQGQEIDENKCVIKSGTFNDRGELDGDSVVIDYGGSNVNIRVGTYVDGKEDGAVYEYVFAKSSWGAFHSHSGGVASTRYKHIFNDGSWTTTQETINNKRIKGACSKQRCKMDNWTSFNFAEL